MSGYLRIFVIGFTLFSTHLLLSIETLSISGNPPTLTINAVTAGSNPNSVSNATTRFSLTLMGTARVLTANLTANMPSNVTLQIQSAYRTTGLQIMTTTPAALTTSIPRFTITSGRVLTYQLSATAAAEPVTNATRTVVYTLI